MKCVRIRVEIEDKKKNTRHVSWLKLNRPTATQLKDALECYNAIGASSRTINTKLKSVKAHVKKALK